MQQPLCRSFVAVVAMSTKSFEADLEAVECHSTASRSTPKLRLVMHTFSLLWAMQRCSLHQAPLRSRRVKGPAARGLDARSSRNRCNGFPEWGPLTGCPSGLCPAKRAAPAAKLYATH